MIGRKRSRHALWWPCVPATLAGIVLVAFSLLMASDRPRSDVADGAAPAQVERIRLTERGPQVEAIETLTNQTAPLPSQVQPVQWESPILNGVDCQDCDLSCGEPHWNASRPIPWQVFAHGEYIGPARTPHVPEYRLRVDDQVEFIYRFTHEESTESYRLSVGDEIIIESLTDAALNRGDLNQGRGLVIQPDGTISLPLLGQVNVARLTVSETREALDAMYEKYYKSPTITVTPLKTNTRLEDLRATVDGRFGRGGQRQDSPVTPEGTIQLPGVGSVPAHGLTLPELEQEIELRYRQLVGPGVEVTPVLRQRAPRFIYVVGEVATPGQFELRQPTTIMAAIALAGGWNVGGNGRIRTYNPRFRRPMRYPIAPPHLKPSVPSLPFRRLPRTARLD